MSGKLKSPHSQKMEFLCFDLISEISVHIFSASVRSKSGALYAQHKMMGGFFGTLTLTKTLSECLLFRIRELSNVFFIPIRTPPPVVWVRSLLKI